MERFDVAVAGLGAMGSAAVYQLAKEGVNVLGIDQYDPPHTLGSTHGDTRITRLAIGEGEEYVPLVMRSHELWQDIEQQIDYELLNQCGGLIMGIHSGEGQHGINDFLRQTTESANKYGIEHQTPSRSEIQERFPQFNLVGKEDSYYEPAAGFLRPEKCVQAQLDLAKQSGATIRTNEKILGYEDNGSSVVITTESGKYEAGKLIVSAGAWVNDLIPVDNDTFKIYRQVLYWFDIQDKSLYDNFASMPIFIWEFGGSADDFIYGFPAIDGVNGGVKVATEDYSETTSPDAVTRDVTQDEIDSMYDRYVKDRLPGLGKTCVKTAACMYTVTPDHRFVIDFHPEHRNVIVASPCSGHGFKHSAAIGESLMQLATNGKSRIDISKFSFGRLS